MTHRSLRLCAILGAIGIGGMIYGLSAAGIALIDAARGGRLITLSWSPTP